MMLLPLETLHKLLHLFTVTKLNLDSTKPLVSVLLGCYNHARFVCEALDSIQSQTYSNLQLIIWDDCSRDESVEKIESWLQRNSVQCIFLRNKVNQGLCKCLNQALAQAKGEYISILSADDIWLPEKTERQVNILEDSSNTVGVVYSDAFQVSENGDLLPSMFIETHRSFSSPPEGEIFYVLYDKNFIPAMSGLIRRQCFNDVGVYDEDLIFEDWDMWMRISRKYLFKYDAIPSTKYRVHPSSMTHAMLEHIYESTEIIRLKYHFYGFLTNDQSEIALTYLDRLVWRFYKNNQTIPAQWKLALLKNCFSVKTLLLVACSTIGITFDKYLKVLKTLSFVKKFSLLNKCL